MAKVVRLGVIGMGIGRANGNAVAANPRGRVEAICDIIPERMDDYAKELKTPDVRKYTNYRKMLKDKELDAIFVGTPNRLHIPMALDAIRAGKHVLCTKPLGHAVAPAVQLVREAEKSGLVNMMSLSTRYSPECKHMESLVRRGFFGQLYYGRARSIRRSGIPDWNLGFIEKGGGAFRDMGVHCLDAAWWLLGMPEPISVTGVSGAKFGPRGEGYWDFRRPAKDFYGKFAADDYGGGFIRFEGGIGLQVESFWASHMPEEFQVELFGSEAGGKVFPPALHRSERGVPHDVQVKMPKGPSGWDNIAAHFIECILDGVKCQSPLRHGLRVQQMMEALLQSGKTGREVRL